MQDVSEEATKYSLETQITYTALLLLIMAVYEKCDVLYSQTVGVMQKEMESLCLVFVLETTTFLARSSEGLSMVHYCRSLTSVERVHGASPRD